MTPMTTAVLPIFVWTKTLPPAKRACSRGCHVLPKTAKFDPHTGASLVPLTFGKTPILCAD